MSYAWSFATDGTTGLRHTSTTYPDSTVITDVYNTGTDDTLSPYRRKLHPASR